MLGTRSELEDSVTAGKTASCLILTGLTALERIYALKPHVDRQCIAVDCACLRRNGRRRRSGRSRPSKSECSDNGYGAHFNSLW